MWICATAPRQNGSSTPETGGTSLTLSEGCDLSHAPRVMVVSILAVIRSRAFELVSSWRSSASADAMLVRLNSSAVAGPGGCFWERLEPVSTLEDSVVLVDGFSQAVTLNAVAVARRKKWNERIPVDDFPANRVTAMWGSEPFTRPAIASL